MAINIVQLQFQLETARSQYTTLATGVDISRAIKSDFYVYISAIVNERAGLGRSGVESCHISMRSAMNQSYKLRHAAGHGAVISAT
jgi:hypothetical protein